MLKKKFALASLLFAVAFLSMPVAHAGDNNTFDLPNSDESKSMWDLATDPFTRWIGGFFYLSIQMALAGVIWDRGGLGIALVWMVASSATLGALPIPGTGSIIFGLAVAVAGSVAVVRIVTKARER